MAQDRAATSPPRKNETKRSGSDSGTEIDTVPADETHATVPTVQTVQTLSGVEEIPESAIDKLLALTEDRWDIDQQVKTLQTAAGGQPFRPEIPRAPKVPSVAIPTP